MSSHQQQTRQQGGPAQDPPVTSTVNEPAVSNQAAQDELPGHDRYTDALGDRVGGFLHEIVHDNVNPDAVDGWANDGLEAGTGAIGDWLREQASPEDAEAAGLFTNHLTTSLNSHFGAGIRDSNLGESVTDFALDNPWPMLGLGVAGAAAYIASDQELDDIDTKIGLGGGNSILLGGDFGSTLSPGIDAVRGGYRYQGDNERFEGMAEADLEKNAYALSADYHRDLVNGGTLDLSAAHHRDEDRHLTTGGIKYRDEDIAAHLNGSYDSADGGVGALSAGFRTLGDGPSWQGGFDANTRGAWNANLGVSHRDEERDLEWFAKGHAGQDALGETDYGVSAGLKWRF